MKNSVSTGTATLLFILLSATGCALNSEAPSTVLETVWSAPPPESVMAAQPLALRLFFSPQRQDLLVVYDEYPRNSSSMRTRAYWLYESEDRLGHDGRVSFVKTNAAPDLVPVQLFNTAAALPTNSPDSLSAVTTDDCTFTVYSGQREVSSHSLPISFVKTGNGTAEKIAATPLAIGADGLISGLKKWLDQP